MLTVIMGHAELALMKLDENDQLRPDLEEISLSAQRSADLTRQLLAFARKQTVAPKLLVLNDTVGAMLKMLQRLIGEDVNLHWHPFNALWPVMMDPSQVDQILANLCVNARDAIEDTGVITIATSNVSIDSDYCCHTPDAVPGDYVCLTVGDTGKGIDMDTLSHIFEPFYTTKGLGEGTGLGLSTVYGVVRQNNGFITVDSEIGKGTTFTIYIPRFNGTTEDNSEVSTINAHVGGNETILLVEDEVAILGITKKMLEQLGYTVIGTTDSKEALKFAKNHAGPINLLITDVIMPNINGRELADSIVAVHPACKQLYMSGYTADIIGQHGVLNAEVQFIQKPFSLELLSKKVRETLEA